MADLQDEQIMNKYGRYYRYSTVPHFILKVIRYRNQDEVWVEAGSSSYIGFIATKNLDKFYEELSDEEVLMYKMAK
jgi:hypothetical protein